MEESDLSACSCQEAYSVLICWPRYKVVVHIDVIHVCWQRSVVLTRRDAVCEVPKSVQRDRENTSISLTCPLMSLRMRVVEVN